MDTSTLLTYAIKMRKFLVEFSALNDGKLIQPFAGVLLKIY